MVEHDLGKLMGGAGRLDTQVSKHGIRAPAAQKAGDGGVNVPTEEGCSPPRAERLGGYFMRRNSREVLAGPGRRPKEQGDVVGRDLNGDGFAFAVGCVEGKQRSFGWSIVVAELDGEAESGADWAELWVGGFMVADLFALDSVLLVSEGKCNKVGFLQVIQRRSVGWK